MSAVAPEARPAATHRAAPRNGGLGVITGWGEGVAALPTAASERGAGLIAVPTPTLGGDRFRRATRECLLAVAAAKAAVADAGFSESELGGPRTGILYVGATGYAAANRAFLEDETSTTLHFPYTSPSAVPGEVTIELGVRGPYVNLMGGGPAALEALWWAARWLVEGRADRLLVLAVEAFHEVRDLFDRARRLYTGPLVEGATCLLLESEPAEPLRWASTIAGPASAFRAIATVLAEVLDGARPRLTWSGVTGPSLVRAEARILATSEKPVEAFRLGEALALG